jgi:hypothetical protein
MDDQIEYICRHTNYSALEAEEQLAAHGDVSKVIQFYLNTPKKTEPKRSTNQTMFHEITKFVEQIKGNNKI